MGKKESTRKHRLAAPHPAPPTPSPSPSWKGATPYVALCAILIWSAALLSRSFHIPHASGDQRLYLALAMKLDTAGFKGYSLREVKRTVSAGALQYSYMPGERGDLVAQLEREGTRFYDQPLCVQLPLFPYLIMVSHRMFASDQPYQVRALGFETAAMKAGQPPVNQFYCCIVPLLCSLLLLPSCFWIGKLIHSNAAGIVAAAMLSLTPTYLEAGQRLWADSTLALCVTLTLLFFYLYATRGQLVWALLSAATFGLSLLVKNSALITIAPLLVGFLVCRRGNVSVTKWVTGLALFVLISASIVWPWYQAVTQTYGNPFFTPTQDGISSTVQWFDMINRQPWYAYLVSIPYQVPLFLLGYLGVAALIWDSKNRNGRLYLAASFLAFLLVLTHVTATQEIVGPEPRYMLPAYPPLAVLSAVVFEKVRAFLMAKWSPAVGITLTAIAFIASAVWSHHLADKYKTMDVIWAPF